MQFGCTTFNILSSFVHQNFGFSFHTHKTFIDFSSFLRMFIFELCVMGTESYRRWLAMIFEGDGTPTSSLNSAEGFLNFTVSECDSSDEVPDVFTDRSVECKGKPISWNEFMLEKPLSSSVWHVENRFDLVRLFAGMVLILVVAVGKFVGYSSSLFDELDDCTDDSSVLRRDKCDSRSKPNEKSFRCGSNGGRGNPIASEVLLMACDKIGSWVLRKFWTVRDRR